MNVLVVGSGYLGSKVALEFKRRKDHVTATTRTPARLEEIVKVAQKGVLLPWNPEIDDLLPLIAANDLIVVTIAAGGMESYDSAYRHTAHLFRQIAREIHTPKQLIYTSSTSVYGNHQGKWVDETSDPLASTEQGKILIEAEQIFSSLEEYGWKIAILRLAEIYGPGREISKRLSIIDGRPLPGTGDQYTNMIHVDDCVGAILYIKDHHLTGIYNLSDEDHPTRKQLYEEAAKHFNLTSPQWDPNLTSLHVGNKRVSIHKWQAAGGPLKHPHRVLS